MLYLNLPPRESTQLYILFITEARTIGAIHNALPPKVKERCVAMIFCTTEQYRDSIVLA